MDPANHPGILEGAFEQVNATDAEHLELKRPDAPTWLDILLDKPPSPWADGKSSTMNATIKDKSKMDTSKEFKDWIHARTLSVKDGILLFRLKEHIMNGGHPDFPRLRYKKNKDGSDTPTQCLKHMTSDYYTSIDTECLQWIKKQRKLYRNRTIHPWLQWKLEQLNVTLEWLVL